MKSSSVSLVIPVLNEIQGLTELMPRIEREWYDQLIFVDGGSTDGSKEYIRNNGYTLIEQQSRGVRPALEEAFQIVQGDILIVFTPDGNSIPELLPDLRKEIEKGYDLVIVSRYLDGATSLDDDLLSMIGNRFFSVLLSLVCGHKYTDVLVGFRAYQCDALVMAGLGNGPAYSFERLFYTYTSWDFLSSMRFARRKMKVGEISGSEPKRIGDKSKVPKLRVAIVALLQLVIESIIKVGK